MIILAGRADLPQSARRFALGFATKTPQGHPAARRNGRQCTVEHHCHRAAPVPSPGLRLHLLWVGRTDGVVEVLQRAGTAA